MYNTNCFLTLRTISRQQKFVPQKASSGKLIALRVCMQSLQSSPPGEADKLAKCGKKKFRHHVTNSEQKETLFFPVIQPVMLGRTGTVTKQTGRLQEETERNLGMGRVCCFEGSLLQLPSLTSLDLRPPLFPFCDLSFPQLRLLSLPSPPSPS